MFAIYRSRPARELILTLLAVVAPGTAPLAAAQEKEGEVEWSFKDGRLSAKGGDFSFDIGGGLQIDYAAYNDDEADLLDGSEFRRGRIFVKGDAWKHWSYKFQYDFIASSDPVKDAYLFYKGFKPFAFGVGHIKEPFSLEALSSSKYITFMERPLPTIFFLGRNLGVTAIMTGASGSAQVGLFQEVDDLGDGRNEENAVDLGGRFVYAFMRSKKELLHVGVSLLYRDIPSASGTQRFRARPESHVTDVRLIDTGSGTITDASDMFSFGLESALVYNNLSLQAEYMSADLSRDEGEDLRFDGYYLQVSWFLNPADARSYSVSKVGTFGKIRPAGIVGKGGRGSWELGARYSNLNLDDGDVDGGEQDNFSLALNWYATPTIRFSVNYVQVLSVDGGPNDGDEPSAVQARVQIEF